MDFTDDSNMLNYDLEDYFDPVHLKLDGVNFIFTGYRQDNFFYFHVVCLARKEIADKFIYCLTLSGGNRPVSFRKRIF